MNDLMIGVIGGLGHIGLIQAACLAELGYHTIAYDINRMKLEGVQKGIMPFKEYGLEETVANAIRKNKINFTDDIRDLGNADIVFICVGTPSKDNGEADLSQVYSAIEQLALNRSKHCLAVVKSTVPVGTSRKLTEFLRAKGLSERLTMVSNPEFLKEGTGVKDFWEPARIVVGSQSKDAAERVAHLYAPQGVPIILTSWENAELIKLVSNAFLSTKISFINEISQLCERVGGDVRVISRGIGLDPRINPYFIEAGVGFSGPCLEKDLKSLISQFQNAEKKAYILESALLVNEEQRNSMVHKLEEHLGTLKDKKIAVLGMAFKQETDDVRQSHNLPIVKQLLSKGAIVTVTDPWVKSAEQGGLAEGELPGVQWVDSPYEAAEGKDAMVILTAWQEYRDLDIARIKELMAKPILVDGRNLFDVDKMKENGITYTGVGI